MADVKYPDYTPVDEPVVKDYKVPSVGSGIRVEKEPKSAPKAVKKLSAGGSASSRADGIAQRGKTKGTLIMCGGGYTKGKK